MIYIGCCGFPVSRKRYFREFIAVEIQQTFYQIPKIDTLSRWRRDAPDNFEFIIKAWQGITHPYTSPTWRRFKGILKGEKGNYGGLKYTEEVLNAWKKTLNAMEILNSDKVVVQLPPRLKWIDEVKDEVVKTLTEFTKHNVKIIIEPRNRTWWNDEVEEIFNKLNIVHCVDPFKHKMFKTGEFCYFRLHGINGYNYSYKYTERDLETLAENVSDYSSKDDCYIMFNNRYMYEDAIEFKGILLEKGLYVI